MSSNGLRADLHILRALMCRMSRILDGECDGRVTEAQHEAYDWTDTLFTQAGTSERSTSGQSLVS